MNNFETSFIIYTFDEISHISIVIESFSILIDENKFYPIKIKENFFTKFYQTFKLNTFPDQIQAQLKKLNGLNSLSLFYVEFHVLQYISKYHSNNSLFNKFIDDFNSNISHQYNHQYNHQYLQELEVTRISRIKKEEDICKLKKRLSVIQFSQNDSFQNVETFVQHFIHMTNLFKLLVSHLPTTTVFLQLKSGYHFSDNIPRTFSDAKRFVSLPKETRKKHFSQLKSYLEQLLI
jgi:uncharacterized protein YdcH (DUF465 family)